MALGHASYVEEGRTFPLAGQTVGPEGQRNDLEVQNHSWVHQTEVEGHGIRGEGHVHRNLVHPSMGEVDLALVDPASSCEVVDLAAANLAFVGLQAEVRPEVVEVSLLVQHFLLLMSSRIGWFDQ